MNIQTLQHNLRKPLKNQWALSTVVTTLIVLVISVLLAGVVTYFAINVTSTRVQEESLDLAKQHVWFDFSSSKTQAAIMIINSGGRDVVIDKLTVRGQQCDWAKVFFNQTTASIASDLSYASSLTDGSAVPIGSTNYVLKQATSAITLQSGKTLIIYLNSPDSISVNDIGLTVSVNIFTSQAMYYKETNVQGTSGTTTTSLPSTFTLYGAVAYYKNVAGTPYNEVGMVLYNGANTAVTIATSDLKIDGIHPSVGMTLAAYVGVLSNPPTTLPYWYDESQEVYGQEVKLLLPGYLDIQPGQTAFAYFAWIPSTGFEVGSTITVSLDVSGGVSQTVTVQAG